MAEAAGQAERQAPLVLVVSPTGIGPAAPGSFAAVAAEGQQILAAELSVRLGRAGARVSPLIPERKEGFHWGRWFAAAARAELGGGGGRAGAVGYAGAGSLALLADEALGDLVAPRDGEVVANNRFSADAFVVAGDLSAALAALEACDSDNGAARCLEEAGFRPRDVSAAAYSRFDVDTPLDLALLRFALRLPGTRRPDEAVAAFLEVARLPGQRDLDVPHREAIGAVMRDRKSELVIAGRVPSSAWAYLETETACRVRCFIEERGMRSARGDRPRSLLATLLERSSPADLVAALAEMGDAVILDTRVLMASLAGSADADRWPPEEERFASDFGDASRIATPWLRELVEAAQASPVPFILGGHALVSDGLRLLVDAAWLGR